MVDFYVDSTKTPDDLKREVLSLSCVVQSLIEEKDAKQVKGMLNAASAFNQITLGHMAEEQRKDPILRVVCP